MLIRKILKEISEEIKQVILLFQFMTRIPTFINVEYSPLKIGKSIKYFPLIGLIIGSIMYFSTLLLEYAGVKRDFLVLILILLDLFLVGIIHLDGLSDSADALFSYKNKDDMLLIMKDSRVGTNGVVILIIYFLSKYLLFYYICERPVYFIIIYVCSRLATSVNASLTNYSRKFDEGMSGAIFKYNTINECIFATIESFLLIYLFIGNYAIFYVFLVHFINYIFRKIIIRKIDGFTGDALGFCLELTFIVCLFFTVLLN